MLQVEGLTKRYGTLLALDDVGFEVERGQVVGFLGPNGAGKTTAMRAIMRLVTLDAGEVRWDGAPVDRATRQHFGYMPAERGMYPRMQVGEHLRYYGRLSGLPPSAAEGKAEQWMERLGLAPRAEDPIQSLSSGNQQRVQLALALLQEPELLVLDEPFAGLDPIAAELLGEVLQEQVDRGAALLLSSHQLDLVADACSAVVVVDQGRVVLRGDVADLRTRGDTRYVEVEFASPVAWTPDGRTSTPVGADGRRHRTAVTTGADADALIADARRAGDVVGYSFEPPDLSEIFLGAVGRRSLHTDGEQSR